MHYILEYVGTNELFGICTNEAVELYIPRVEQELFLVHCDNIQSYSIPI